jgi:hypothetical protein
VQKLLATHKQSKNQKRRFCKIVQIKFKIYSQKCLMLMAKKELHLYKSDNTPYLNNTFQLSKINQESFTKTKIKLISLTILYKQECQLYRLNQNQNKQPKSNL